MNKESSFNQGRYINQYQKEHYKQFNVRLKKEVYSEIEKILELNNITKHDLIRKWVEDTKNNKYVIK